MVPPNKGRHRAQPSQPHAPLPSDYETDAPQSIDMPPPPPRSNEELNLSVIRRHYREVTSIHYVAPYAVLYAFSLDSQQWEKVGIEGSLFICELTLAASGAERYAVVILNRRNMDNFYMDIVGPDGLEFTDEYIIMQGDQVYGLWIFCEPPPSSTASIRAETVAKIQELASRVQASQVAEQNNDNDSLASEPVQSSVPMGRQLSLRELFGHQRTQDSSWSVHNHHTAQPEAMHQNYQPAQVPQPAQNDVLSQLFMKAKQDYNNFG